MAEPSAASFALPEPAPELLAPPAGDDRAFEASYFDPERWDAEFTRWRGPDDRDPVRHNLGKQTGHGGAVLFVSDFHMGDGTAGGDDFLESHILPDKDLGLYTGFFPPGESRARLFVSVLTFALRRVVEQAGADTRLDVVLLGDVINFIELKGRGGTFVSRKHRPFFRALAALRPGADVYYLRGNHDYIVPSGPWQPGEFYVNERLRVLAEHGDFWDKENWPPGPENKGSRLIIEAGSAFEVHCGVMKDGTIKYLMSGLDNLRPWNNDAVEGFLDRRAKFSKVAWLSALMARLKYVGAADDSAAFQGAQGRRTGAYRDWLMVQGHTHVPALVPGVYCNTGTWIATLTAVKGQERHIEAFPFLLVYGGADGKRVEEYFIVFLPAPGERARIELQTPESVNALRREFGYQDLGA